MLSDDSGGERRAAHLAAAVFEHLAHVAGHDERTGRYAVYNSIDVPRAARGAGYHQRAVMQRAVA